MSNPLSNYTDSNLEDLASYYEGLGPQRPVRATRREAPVMTPAPSPQKTMAPAKTHHKAAKKNRKPSSQGTGQAQ